MASWPAVEGTGSGGARSRGAAADNARVVLIEQEGPAWTEIVWDEVMFLFQKGGQIRFKRSHVVSEMVGTYV